MQPSRAVALTAAFGLPALAAWESRRPRSPLPFELPALTRDAGMAVGSVVQGRIFAAAWSLAALALLVAFVARLVDRRAAAYVLAVVPTTPMWFVHGRAMTGEVVGMAGITAAVAGIGLAALDTKLGKAMRGLAALVGCAGLGAFVHAHTGAVAKVGASAGLATSTTDAMLRVGLYALVPWVVLMPFAFLHRPRTRGHAVLVASAIVLAGIDTLSAGTHLLAGTALSLAVVAIFLRQLDDEARPNTLLACAVFGIGALVAHDVALSPERTVAVLGAKLDIAGLSEATTKAARDVKIATWLVVVAALAALVVSRDVLHLRTRRLSTRVPRGAIVLAFGFVAGLGLRLYTYPSLLSRLSPSAAFDAWLDRRTAKDRLASLGVDPRLLPPASDPVVVRSATHALTFLDEPSDTARAFVLLGAPELAAVNAAFRQRHGHNVPLIVGGSESVLLAASTLGPGEHDENPLGTTVMSEVPRDLRPFEATLGGKIDIVGWRLTGDRLGRTSTSRLRVAMRVKEGGDRALLGYCTFVHADDDQRHGTSTRFSVEHREHAYPTRFWQSGDVIVDELELAMPARHRSGTYSLYFGAGVLPCEDGRRMPVTSGPDDGQSRVLLGHVELR